MVLGNHKWLAEINRWELVIIIASIPLISPHLCFHLFWLATTQVEAKLCAVEEDTFEVYLYVTIRNEKVSEIIVFLKYFIIGKHFYFNKTRIDTKGNSVEIFLIFQGLA